MVDQLEAEAANMDHGEIVLLVRGMVSVVAEHEARRLESFRGGRGSRQLQELYVMRSFAACAAKAQKRLSRLQPATPMSEHALSADALVAEMQSYRNGVNE